MDRQYLKGYECSASLPRSHTRVPQQSVSSLEHFSCQSHNDNPTFQVTGEKRQSSLSAFNTNDELKNKRREQ